MVVMWKTERGAARIERVECTRATSGSVWFMKSPFVIGGNPPPPVEVKAGRVGVNTTYHASWEDAHAHLLEQAVFAVQSKRRQLELANAYHGNVKGLRKPAEAAVGAA